MTDGIDSIVDELTAAGIISGVKTRCRPLAGGVSSEIFLLEEPDHTVVVKQARPRLKVQDLWQVDVRRNRVEQQFIRFVATFLPEAMPRILYADEKHEVVLQVLFHKKERDRLFVGHSIFDDQVHIFLGDKG